MQFVKISVMNINSAMTFSPNLNAYLNILSLVALAVVAFYVVRSKVKNENLKDLQARVEILERERAETARLHTQEREETARLQAEERERNQQQHLENQKAIANLEGQLATYKEIPLKSIAESLVKITDSNDVIMNSLLGSAKEAKEAQADGGLLVKTNPKGPLLVETKETNPLDVKPVDEKELK